VGGHRRFARNAVPCETATTPVGSARQRPNDGALLAETYKSRCMSIIYVILRKWNVLEPFALPSIHAPVFAVESNVAPRDIVESVSSMSITGQIAICFSHLRWDFVYQRPQHLIEQLSAEMPVIFWEEPVFAPGTMPELVLEPRSQQLVVARMRLPEGMAADRAEKAQRDALDGLLHARGVRPALLWYYTPMMLGFSAHLAADLVVYDCMDELSAFRGAPAGLRDSEARLMARADLVFTGGHSLYEAKRDRHPDIHPFPSSVDVAHFATARTGLPEPDDQRTIPHPRIGYYGVIDERLDTALLAGLADARPDWQFVMLGPVVKIAPEDLPRRANIHYLGAKAYRDLPGYVAGWNVALMPFALNEATRFISPTKLPEYLAAGRPVVSTPIVDVVRQYSDLPGVAIAEGNDAFLDGIEASLAIGTHHPTWHHRVDAMLAGMSWDRTWAAMSALITQKRMARQAPAATALPRQVAIPRTVHLARRAAYDYLVVGAGFAGAVLAERLARADGAKVLVVDRRPHIGGNAYDHHDAAGLLVHQYGPHIFHTNAPRVVEYLSRFTRWRPYEHRVLASIGNQLLPVPINRTTVNRFFGLDLSETEVEAFLASRASRCRTSAPARTSCCPRSAASSTRRCSAATPASNGASSPTSSTNPSPAASPCAPTTTTATSTIPSSRCPCTATRACSRTCSTTPA